MKTRTEHEVIFNSYPASKLKDIIKKTNITLTNLTKAEIVKAMLKRRRAFDWLEKYEGVDSYKSHPKYKKLVSEKESEQDKKDIKENQKVRKFKRGGRSAVVGSIELPKTAKKKAMKNPTYKKVNPGRKYQEVFPDEPRYQEVFPDKPKTANKKAVRNPNYKTVKPSKKK